MANSNEVRNYSTKIPAARTVGEIQALLAANGARRIMVEYSGNSEPTAVSFAISVHGREQYFRLPINPAATLERLRSDDRAQRRGVATQEQAYCTSWRNVLMWIEAQLEFVKDGQVELAQVMLPYLLVEENQTLWQKFRERPLLTAGGNS